MRIASVLALLAFVVVPVASMATLPACSTSSVTPGDDLADTGVPGNGDATSDTGVVPDGAPDVVTDGPADGGTTLCPDDAGVFPGAAGRCNNNVACAAGCACTAGGCTCPTTAACVTVNCGTIVCAGGVCSDPASSTCGFEMADASHPACDAGATDAGWPLCCPGDTCTNVDGCFGNVSYEGQSYAGGTCWACQDPVSGAPTSCSGCGGKGFECCTIAGLHRVCAPGLTCSSQQVGGTCM